MSWEKLLVILVAVYLIIAIPLYLLNEQQVATCYPVCEAEGLDIVISVVTDQATGKEMCRCMSSTERTDYYLEAKKK
jgi:hypothetical protein